jgi:hypothetical protein
MTAETRQQCTCISVFYAERNSFDHMLVLCRSCHTIVDANEAVYMVERLQPMKRGRGPMRARLDELVDDPFLGGVWCCPNCGAPATEFQHHDYSDARTTGITARRMPELRRALGWRNIAGHRPTGRAMAGNKAARTGLKFTSDNKS